MTCCPEFERLMERGLAEHAQPHQLSGGTIITEIDTEYSWSSARSRAVSPASITALLRRVLSRELWNREKRNSGRGPDALVRAGPLVRLSADHIRMRKQGRRGVRSSPGVAHPPVHLVNSKIVVDFYDNRSYNMA